MSRRPFQRRARVSWAIATLATIGTMGLYAPIAVSAQSQGSSGRQPLPAKLTDAEYWTLLSAISEPGGSFRNSDNFTSNEMEVGGLFTTLRTMRVAGGVYLGVGPEQNFTYIAAIRPAMAFVVDIRRQAVIQHLMFKAIFELSKDRADFIALLFSRTRPPGLDSTTSIQAMWNAYRSVPTTAQRATANYTRIEEHLVKAHGFALTADEIGMLKWVWDAFTTYGPEITTQVGQGARGGGRGGGRGGRAGNFAELTGASMDAGAQVRSFLSSEENFRSIKTLQEKNLIVPVSGDFAGPKAVRAIGAYLKDHGATVTAYYVSNVEQYLFQDGKQAAFYENVATLPVTESSVFIRPYALRSGGQPLCPIATYLRAFTAGRVPVYESSLTCPR